MEVNFVTGDAARGGGHGDMDWTVNGLQELPERCGGVVTQNRSLTACEHCGHPALALGHGEGTEGIDASMNAMQLPFANSNRDRS